MRKYISLVISFIIFIQISADYVLSDENEKTIEAGEYVYINNTEGLDGFSIDYNKKLFVNGGIVKDEGDRILIGRLRDDIQSGTADTIIFNTIEGMNYLELKVSPVFFNLNLNERENNKDTIISGSLSFESKSKQTLSGIDSVKLIISSQDERYLKSMDIYREDRLDEDGVLSFIDFEFSIDNVQSDFAISVAHYSLDLAETTYFIAGFSTNEKEEYPQNLLIIDSRSKIMTENLTDAYYDKRFEIVKTFYENFDTSILNLTENGIMVLVTVEGGYIIENLNLFSKLKDISSDFSLFIFSNNLCKYLLHEDNRSAKDYFEMLFDMKCSEISSFDEIECEGIKSIRNMELETIENGNGERVSFIRKGNIFLFLFLPDKIDIDQLCAIRKNADLSVIKENMKSLSSIEDIEYQGYGEYSLEIYDISGKKLFSKILGDIPSTMKSIDMSEFLKNENIYTAGVYTFKIKKNGECIKCGNFYFVFH
ncbi:MAG: hypothetical protein COX48_01865 [bacterium (Candidatus Stahlbacteria) CG23_combo_of_CG06-09_8_20_14_all_34_7]|nr:MAG: hypothetical protein COX48_01865 [bacterium (Candidatus Stahlbacteria) CG23_combo_of_CG06-09_8_20_14_all_34_7]